MKYKLFLLILLFCIVNIYSQEYNGEFFKYPLGTEYDYIVNSEGLSGFVFNETSRVNYIDIEENIFGFNLKYRYRFRTDIKYKEANTLTSCSIEREGYKSILVDLDPRSRRYFENAGIEYYIEDVEYYIDNNEEVKYNRNLFYNIANYYNELYGANELVEIEDYYDGRKIYYFSASQNGEFFHFVMSFGIYRNGRYHVDIHLQMYNDVDEGR